MTKLSESYIAIAAWGHILIPTKYLSVLDEVILADRKYNKDTSKYDWVVTHDKELELKLLRQEVVTAAIVTGKLEGAK